MGILWTIIIGFVVGLLARFIKPGDDSMGIIFTTLLGIAGAFVAGFVGKNIGLYQANEPVGFIASILGAVALLFLARLLRSRRTA